MSEKGKIKTKPQREPLTKKRIGELALDNLCWFIGCCLYAAAINFFNVPNNIAQGGFSGVAIVINYLTKLPVGAVNFVLNIPLFILAWIFVGKKFVYKSLWVTVMLSVIIDIMAALFDGYAYTGDKLLAAIFGGALSGAGVALVLMRGATTGGTDILSRLLRLIMPHISFGKFIMLTDLIVIATAAIVFRSVESALYAAIVIFVSSRLIDYVLYGLDKGKMLMVVTDHAREVADSLTKNMPRGVTILPVTGGYTGEQKNMLVCVLRSNEVARTIKMIKSVDPNTFTIITEATEIIGKGFKSSIND